MKTFALALLTVTASASLADILSFNFDEYFEKVEEPASPQLESFTYKYELFGPEVPESGPWYLTLVDFTTIGFTATANGDANI